MTLTDRRCQACEGGLPVLDDDSIDFLLADEGLDAWRRVDGRLVRSWKRKDFRGCIDLLRDFADLAEDEGHHPDLRIHGYRNLEAVVYTHAVDGITENDLILAAKMERLARV